MKIIVSLALLISVSFPMGSVFAAGPGSAKTAPVFSLEANNESFASVADEIFKQTGYRVVFDEKWNTLPVTGKYTDVTIEEFCRRVFRKMNTSLLVNDKSKIYVVRFFGDKSFADLLAAKGGGKMEGEEGSGELADLQARQRQALQDYLADPEAVDPISGMKLVEIRAMHENERSELEMMRQEPDTVEPTSGETIGNLEQAHVNQHEEIENLRNNPNALDQESGMSIGEISDMHSNQKAVLNETLKNPDTVDPISGEPLSEIWKKANKAK